MEEKWDGKTKGSLWGYRFFVFCIRTFGLNFSYLFSYFVSIYYVLFSRDQRNGLMKFYKVAFGYNKSKARRSTFRNFYLFGQTLIDRVALRTKRNKKFTYTFNNETVLRSLHEKRQGGFLISGHVGNWENAGNLIKQRITGTINIVMLDKEVEKIKSYMESETGGPEYKLIPIKNDMSHLILIHQALKRHELVAIHADRVSGTMKTIELPFFGKPTKFPAGPFIMAHKFKVPITFVFAAKGSKFHYDLYATDLISDSKSPEEIAKKYVDYLETMVKKYPTQWFNFYDYYAS